MDPTLTQIYCFLSPSLFPPPAFPTNPAAPAFTDPAADDPHFCSPCHACCARAPTLPLLSAGCGSFEGSAACVLLEFLLAAAELEGLFELDAFPLRCEDCCCCDACPSACCVVPCCSVCEVDAFQRFEMRGKRLVPCWDCCSSCCCCCCSCARWAESAVRWAMAACGVSDCKAEMFEYCQ